jgi:hypothetical protein
MENADGTASTADIDYTIEFLEFLAGAMSPPVTNPAKVPEAEAAQEVAPRADGEQKREAA